MKIVVLDGKTLNPSDLSWQGFEKFGTVKVYDRTTFDPEDVTAVVEKAKDAEIILTNKTPLTKKMLVQLPHLKYIGVLATSFNVVDVVASQQLGITVTNIPTYGTNAVSQYAIALLLELCHHIGEHNRSVQNGDWANKADWCYWNYPLTELAGKTMGIVGYGRIGKQTGKIAQAMGMEVIAYDIAPSADTIARYVTLNTLFHSADVIVLHCLLTEETRKLINTDTIEKMKNNVFLINNSRGELVDQQALADALKNGKVAGAAVDVVEKEPIAQDNPLLELDNCIITPHISWASHELRVRLMNIAVENLEKYLENDPVNVVSGN